MRTGDIILVTDIDGRTARDMLKSLKLDARAFNPTEGDWKNCPILIRNIDEDYFPDIKSVFDKRGAMTRFFKLTEFEVMSDDTPELADLIGQLKERELS